MWMILFALVFTVAAATEPFPEEDQNICKDRYYYCYRHKNLCTDKYYKHWMKENCAKTCGYCGTTPKPSTTKAGQTIPPYTGKCGKPEIKGIEITRVVGGKTAVRGSWPWQILLSYNGYATCGGTLIAPNWVVTAAHCVYRREAYPERYMVRVGEHDRTKREGSEVDLRVRKILRHPKWNPYKLDNDIALLRLDKPAKFGKYVAAACLPSEKIPVGSKCYITGWGKTHHPGHMTDILQQGLLPVVSNKVCYEKNHKIIPIPITDAMICGGSGGTDRLSGCHGDSGGPFVCKVNGTWELHGSVSHGSPVCKSTQTYTVFSRTWHFVAWIKEMQSHW